MEMSMIDQRLMWNEGYEPRGPARWAVADPRETCQTEDMEARAGLPFPQISAGFKCLTCEKRVTELCGVWTKVSNLKSAQPDIRLNAARSVYRSARIGSLVGERRQKDAAG